MSLFLSVLTAGERDVIFLIDSTVGVSGINSVREFIKTFVESMPIGPDGVQVGVAQYSDAPRLVMDLNTHATKESIVAALGGIRPKPGTQINTGAALDFVRTKMLLPEKGSRADQAVSQLVLLIANKKSSDSAVEPATALLRMGVLTLAAGGKNADREELKQVAFADNAVYILKDVRVLGRLTAPQPKEIIHALSTLSGVIVTEIPTEPGNNVFHV